jgi:hypothetical protein
MPDHGHIQLVRQFLLGLPEDDAGQDVDSQRNPDESHKKAAGEDLGHHPRLGGPVSSRVRLEKLGILPEQQADAEEEEENLFAGERLMSAIRTEPKRSGSSAAPKCKAGAC